MHWSTWRMLAAAVALSGVLAGLVVNIARASRMQQNLGLVLENYFSFFTIVTMISTAVVFIIASRRGRADPDAVEPTSLAVALATTSAAVIILGIVYNAMLRGIPLILESPDPPVIAFLDRWAIETMHVVVPLYVVADVLFAPRRRALTWRSLFAIVGIPIVWAVYTMVRGPFVPAPDGSTPYWYPYPFLDPNGNGGYATPVTYIGAIAAGFLVIGSGLILLTHRHHAPRASGASHPPRLRPRAHS